MCAKKKGKAPSDRVEEGALPIQIDPARYKAPIDLDLAEVQLLLDFLGKIGLQGTADELERMLPVVRSVRNKLLAAMMVIEKKLPKPSR